MTSTARRAVTVAASLAAVGALAACGTADEAATTAPPESAESSAQATDDVDADADATAETEDGAESGVATEAPTDAEAGGYTDGSYTATGSYISPGGEESVEVTLTLAADVVTDVEVVSLAKHPNSERFQGEFISGIADVVVGVPIDELAVDKVAGSSLTSGGFNEAVDLIKDEARA